MEALANLTKNIADLVKASEAGNYDAAPSTLVQGAALQKEDLSAKLENVCFKDKSIVIQKLMDVEPCKSNTWQFVTENSYGDFEGGWQLEGHVGPENTADYARHVVPMAYCVDYRRVTEVSMMVDTIDGKKADDRAAESASKKVAGDFEFGAFRGADDFNNGGVYDGSPGALPVQTPGMHGVFLQVRQSESLNSFKDLMFNEFGGSDSIVFSVGGTLTQSVIEDMRTRSNMNHGEAEKLVIDPVTWGAYNKITYPMQRLPLAGSPQEATGARIKMQWTANGDVGIVSSRFLSGKTAPARFRDTSPLIASSLSATSTTTSGVVTPFKAGEVYQYFVTGRNENGGEGTKKTASCTISVAGDEVVLTIGAPSSLNNPVRYWNVYRSLAGGSQASAKYIGRVSAASDGSGSFHDQGNKVPGFVTGILFDETTSELRELAGFTRKKLAETALSTPEVFYRFGCVAVKRPREMAIADNITG